MLQGVRFSCLLFAQESPIIMAGMSNGNVAVVRVHDVYDWDASSISQVNLSICNYGQPCHMHGCLQLQARANFFPIIRYIYDEKHQELDGWQASST